MPTTEEHLRLSGKLREFIGRLGPDELAANIELATAAAYWAALHQIDAVLALPELNQHPDSDGQRTRVMQSGGTVMRGLFRHYRLLKDRYNEAMYLAEPLTVVDFTLEVMEALEEIVAKTNRALGRA